MNKRQLKKDEKKYIPIIADEVNLLMMTVDEQNKALEEYMIFRKKNAYRKKYKDLKEAKPLLYFYPLGNSGRQFIDKQELRKDRGRYSTTITQTFDEKTRSLLQDTYVSRCEG